MFNLMRLIHRSFSSSPTNYVLQTILPISQLCSNGRLQEALLEMAMLGPEMGFHGYDALLNACLDKRALRDGQRVHAHMIKTRYLPATYLRTRLLIFYGKCDCLEDARKVLDEMPEKNVVSWTAMISRYSQTGHSSEALTVFAEMMRSDGKPNEFTFATVLTSCIRASGLGLGKQIHGLIVKWNYDSHIFVGSSLLDMYAKAGQIKEAREIFECLPERDVVSCTAIIAGYAQLGLDEEALEMFHRLHSEGMSPNYVTYASLLTALSGLALLDHGKQAHCHVLRRELPFYAVLQNSLIDMYSKCGNLSYARRLFDNMPERTAISWNAMLVGYSKHGHGRMEDTGLNIFDGMVAGEYGTKPGTEHYGCIVDMLGRAGRIDEAFEFIKRMPSKPTAGVLGSLLGACRVHLSVDIGESVGRRLIEIEPENAGNYVILSNLYASAGRWADVNNVRAMMMQKAVTKEPGRSWIQHEQTLHYFHANDRTHPRREEVLAKMKEISIKMKQAGYVPDLSCVLYDVDEEQKEKMLLGHSEKLALTFGLIATGEGIPIRVFKNLRICVDCHNFAKIFSKVFEREVSLRDKNRFHQIVDGICSCGDYW
ncbi:Pentatricopeptide repeat (PPR) superfamily protein [Arabidopsis thaliana]|uniref:Pentatricopeptide repeat (PPR) superfamily protein n=1 Tax=Arabidopsis thaliana TaxID=3702 RepID=A0A1I9LQL2_ARATH|nr:Pentatricopeptide repeat (PPR) superfamily protein [Arabidopsis thaliana]ANM64870.1 Pentatricopeptide repeat (PPR) superfamily protein [Arabidopsis thaliana]|eukprot:NP_001326873.1 Pentatricopeptide repeat (PPR) superfamily protein [Arabidopsis thaliana]